MIRIIIFRLKQTLIPIFVGNINHKRCAFGEWLIKSRYQALEPEDVVHESIVDMQISKIRFRIDIL